jgi:hypothetical protein
MSAASKGISCGQILTINGLKKPCVRDVSVSGVKIRYQQVDGDTHPGISDGAEGTPRRSPA